MHWRLAARDRASRAYARARHAPSAPALKARLLEIGGPGPSNVKPSARRERSGIRADVHQSQALRGSMPCGLILERLSVGGIGWTGNRRNPVRSGIAPTGWRAARYIRNGAASGR